MRVTPTLFAAAAALSAGSGAQAADGIETPDHRVLERGAGAELRLYDPMIVAEVTVAAQSAQQASSAGFRPLANYIFGANAPGREIAMTAPVTTMPATTGAEPMDGGDGAKIAMTAPVTTAPEDSGRYTVRFMMPSEWTMATLPAPTDDRVALREVPGRHMVAAGWTGARTTEAQSAAEAELDAFVSERGLRPVGPVTVAGYSGPSVPTARKRWEVLREVAPPEG
ncbi:heme-binding protein [Rhodobacteraceae bacterium CCMM004]|nr:heme-binding protein [Rhodobacteraceae bacterium CCMM004]